MIILHDPEEFFACVYHKYAEVQRTIEGGSFPELPLRHESEFLEGINLTPDELVDKLADYFFDLRMDIRVTDIRKVNVWGEIKVFMEGDFEMQGKTVDIEVVFSIWWTVEKGAGNTAFIWKWRIKAQRILHEWL
jgi:hypothetical protein